MHLTRPASPKTLIMAAGAQGESHVSLIHSVPPWGRRHITQITGAFEVLRPNLKDVLYQLEVNSFRDGVLGANDHAGAGLLLTRLGEGGRPTRGPVGVGMRIQDNLRIGPFKLEATAARALTDAPTGAPPAAALLLPRPLRTHSTPLLVPPASAHPDAPAPLSRQQT